MNEIIISQIRQRLEILYQMVDELERSGGGGGEPGTTNYNDLTNKPSVNGHILIGSKTSSDLDLQPVIPDLSTIRSGAALGATSVQPSVMEEALDDKVDKVTGKGLSTNDFTNADKAQITTNKNGIAALANSGSKNRLNTYLAAVKPLNYASAGIWSDNVYTHNGVTFTVNEDGSITINGTSTENGSDFVFSRNAGTSFGGLVLTGSFASDGENAGISIVCRRQNDNEIGRSRNGQPYTIPTGVSVDKIVIHLNAGEKETNRTMYPMIRYAAIEDSTYVPYAPTNRELYEMILALQ